MFDHVICCGIDPGDMTLHLGNYKLKKHGRQSFKVKVSQRQYSETELNSQTYM